MQNSRFRIAAIFAFGALLYIPVTLPASAQSFDSSGNGNLKGDYFLRQVITADLDQFTGAIGRAVSLTGTITFDGHGKYAFNGQKMDTMAGSTAAAYSATGSYSLASDNLLQIQDPIDSTDTERGALTGLGPLAVIASGTEGNNRDLFIAIQAGSSESASTIKGSYQTAFLDFLQGNASQVRNGYATLTSTGNGGFGTVMATGAMANQSYVSAQQSFAGVNYSVTSNGSGTLTFPTSSTPLGALLSGKKTLYVSADGNLLLAGDPNGFDILVGVKASSGTPSNGMFNGSYIAAGLENDASEASAGFNSIDSFYGSTLAFGTQGAGVSHFRTAFFDEPAYDFTTNISFNYAPDGTYNDGTYFHILAANGQAELEVGTGTFYSLTVNMLPSGFVVASQGPVIDPYKIFNSASYAPITNPVAPGEFLTIFGSDLAASTQSASVPFPSKLGGVTVTVNGRQAPISFVSPTQVNIIIPYETLSSRATAESYATLQLNNGSASSNSVTMYVNLSAPGVFALTTNDGTFAPGIGPAAVLHADYSLVTADHPAVAGETLQLYVTGLGAVSPPVTDGAAAPSGSLSQAIDDVFIDILDFNFVDSQADVSYTGLAPGFAGLYQINFTVPAGVASGTAYVNVSTDEATTSEATVYVQ